MKDLKLIGLEREKNILELAIKERHPSLLIGETGIGKTHLVRFLAEKFQRPLVRVPLNGEVGINELLGKWLVRDGSTYWQDGILVDCMRKGLWILLDEINAALPEVLFCLNALLDDSRSIVLTEKDGEEVTPHDDFRFFATMNPSDEYAGTKEMNKALLSRFTVVLSMDSYAPETEREIIKLQGNVDEVSASLLVDVANAIRGLKRGKKIFFTCSVRDVISWAKIFRRNQSLAESFLFAILNKADAEEREIIAKTAEGITNKLKVEWTIQKKQLQKLLTEEILAVKTLMEERDKKLSAILSSMVENFKIFQETMQCGKEK